MVRFIIICFSTLFSSILFSCNDKAGAPIPRDSQLAQLRQSHDILTLQQSFDSIARHTATKNMIALKAIYKTLSAELYTRSIDQLNDNSQYLYKEAVELAKQSQNIGLTIWTQTQLGFYYYAYSQYVKALPYFLETYKAFDSYDPYKIPEANTVFIKNAYFFGTIEQRYKAIDLFKIGLSLSSEDSHEYTDILFGLGRLYLEENDLETAESFFLHTVEISTKYGDEKRYAKSLGELATIHNLRGNSAKAQELLIEDVEISKRNNGTRNTMYAQIQLGKLYFEHGEYTKAEKILNEALIYAESKLYLKGFEKEILEIQIKLEEIKQNESKQLELRKRLDEVNAYISITDGPEIVNKMNWQSQRERIQWKIDVDLAKYEKTFLLKWIWTLISALLLSVTIMMLLYYSKLLKYQKTDFERKLISFKLEKINSEQILHETNNTLASFQTYLFEKDEQIYQLEKELMKRKKKGDTKVQDQIVSLESLLESHLMTDENWLLFKEVFMTEKKEYYDHVIDTLPGLTESNLRIILLQKLDLNNQQISNLLGVTPDAVKKSKQRLRKKYGDLFDQILYSNDGNN